MNIGLAAVTEKENAQISFWMSQRGVTEKAFRCSEIFGGVLLVAIIIVSLYTAVVTAYGLAQIMSGFEEPSSVVWFGPLLATFALSKIWIHTPQGRFIREKARLQREISESFQPSEQVPLDPHSIRIYADQILNAAMDKRRIDLYILFSGFCDLEKVEGV